MSYICLGMHATTHAWRSENNFMELVLSFHLYMGSGIKLRSPDFWGKCLCPYSDSLSKAASVWDGCHQRSRIQAAHTPLFLSGVFGSINRMVTSLWAWVCQMSHTICQKCEIWHHMSNMAHISKSIWTSKDMPVTLALLKWVTLLVSWYLMSKKT